MYSKSTVHSNWYTTVLWSNLMRLILNIFTVYLTGNLTTIESWLGLEPGTSRSSAATLRFVDLELWDNISPIIDSLLFTALLWTAPELLRGILDNHYYPPEGTQKGDVYSFSIICQEIIEQRGPFWIENRNFTAEGISSNIFEEQ